MNIAYIPVRGGSKSIPMKNIKLIAGKPLVFWAIKAACECALIDYVDVSTDNEIIRDVVYNFGFRNVKVLDRSMESASDTASTEQGMLDYAKENDFSNIILIQATSPLITAYDLERGIELQKQDNIESVLSVVRQKRFTWQDSDGVYATPINYSYYSRPRRQDFDGLLVENGAFYITSREALLNSKCRISGNIKTLEMLPESYIELDEPSDWWIVEKLLLDRILPSKLPNIRMFLSDCDGTLTDASMYYSCVGEEMKKFNTRDGVGLRLLKEHGIITGIISGEDSDIVLRRAEKMNVDIVLTKIDNKKDAILQLCDKHNICLQETAYIGDDVNDIDALSSVGLGFCPVDAVQEVKAVAAIKTEAKGGFGAVREAADFILSRCLGV